MVNYLFRMDRDAFQIQENIRDWLLSWVCLKREGLEIVRFHGFI